MESKQKVFIGQTVSGMCPQDADSVKSTKLHGSKFGLISLEVSLQLC